MFLGRPKPLKSPPRLFSSKDGLEVTWQSSSNRLETYEIEYSIVGSQTWEKQRCDSNSTSCTVRGLQPGEKYIFRIRTYNTFGYSDPSPEAIIIYSGKYNIKINYFLILFNIFSHSYKSVYLLSDSVGNIKESGHNKKLT